MLLWLNDRSDAATNFARQFLLNYNDPTASIDGKPVTSAGLVQVYTGAAAAQLIGVERSRNFAPALRYMPAVSRLTLDMALLE